MIKRLRCPVLCLAIAAAFANPRVASASVFTFDSDTAGTVTPFVDTNNGLAATFGGQAAVCNVSGFFVSLTGNALIQNLCVTGESGALSIGFSTDIFAITFDFATASGAASATLTAFEGATLVGSSVFTSTIPAGGFNGEGVASFNGVFNNITFSSSDVLAIDNVSDVPEPATSTLLLAPLALMILVTRRRSLTP